jgi:hypothetical protein
LAGFGLGHIVCAALHGAISFFKFVPFVTNVLWISGAVTAYLGTTWATSFAVRCAPASHQKVRWVVLLSIFAFQLLQLFSIPSLENAMQTKFGAYAVQGFIVVSWLMFRAWKKPL